MCYKLSDQRAQIFWPSGGSNDGRNIRKGINGEKYRDGGSWEFQWNEYLKKGDPGSSYVLSINTTGSNMIICDIGGFDGAEYHGVKIMIGNGVNRTKGSEIRAKGNYQFSFKHNDIGKVNSDGTTWDIKISEDIPDSIFEIGNQIILYSDGYSDIFSSKNIVIHGRCIVKGPVYNWFFDDNGAVKRIHTSYMYP